uniref:hypothetical protein n=1 Tax=Psychrobacillus antarcticus TaxID=2879115 RepID=UPI0024081482
FFFGKKIMEPNLTQTLITKMHTLKRVYYRMRSEVDWFYHMEMNGEKKVRIIIIKAILGIHIIRSIHIIHITRFTHITRSIHITRITNRTHITQ